MRQQHAERGQFAQQRVGLQQIQEIVLPVHAQIAVEAERQAQEHWPKATPVTSITTTPVTTGTQSPKPAQRGPCSLQRKLQPTGRRMKADSTRNIAKCRAVAPKSKASMTANVTGKERQCTGRHRDCQLYAAGGAAGS